jgi:FMN phosphatase YigB (HAD superfamily)
LGSNRRLKVVLSDLDDTLFDNKFSRLQGLMALQEKFPQLKAAAIEELEEEHEELVNADYHGVLDHKITAINGNNRAYRKTV